MTKKAHKSLAKARYDEAHPIISARVSKGFYDEIKSAQGVTGQSLIELLKIAIGKSDAATGKAYNQGHDDGYEEGKKDAVESINSQTLKIQCPSCSCIFVVSLRFEEIKE